MEDSLNNATAVAALIDHTLLKPEATQADVEALCGEARAFKFASVCINPCWVSVASTQLAGSGVWVCTVIGFPLGADEKSTKLFAAERALIAGATELDMVLNIGRLRAGDLEIVRDEIAGLAALAHSNAAILKVILETCLLNPEQKTAACRIASEAQADFVKTSTGFSTGGATVEDVRLMRTLVGRKIGVKAAGGIRSLEALRQMVAAGANRIGTSSGIKIIEEYQAAGGAVPSAAAGNRIAAASEADKY